MKNNFADILRLTSTFDMRLENLVPDTHCSESKSYPNLIHGLKETSKYEIAS